MSVEDLSARYEDRGVPSEWRDITPPEMAAAFHLWYRALPSPKSGFQGGDAAELLIHDPLVALRESGIEVDEDAHIATHVVNHEKTLDRFIMHTMVVVSTNPSTVGIMIAKEEE
jgi:hypothetical protein